MTDVIHRRCRGVTLAQAPAGCATGWSRYAAAAHSRRSRTADIETRSLDELHKAALAEGGELLVYGGGDLPNGSAGTERAFNARFPGMKIRILVDRSKYHHVRIDNQLALGKLACDAVHILSINAYDRWKADGQLMPYKPAGLGSDLSGSEGPRRGLRRLSRCLHSAPCSTPRRSAKRTRRATRSTSSIRNSRTASSCDIRTTTTRYSISSIGWSRAWLGLHGKAAGTKSNSGSVARRRRALRSRRATRP